MKSHNVRTAFPSATVESLELPDDVCRMPSCTSMPTSGDLGDDGEGVQLAASRPASACMAV